MSETAKNSSKIYLIAMSVYWVIFGLITIFAPQLMDLFQSQEGIGAKTEFSNHVWMHDGFDIVSLCIVLFALSREKLSRNILRAVAFAALLPTLSIANSLLTTPYWNPLFIGAGLGCCVFVIWGFVLAGRMKDSESK